jgi:hypothetical protein
MFSKITLLVAAAAILLTSASATFAGPRDHQGRVPEPIYFKHATGEEG